MTTRRSDDTGMPSRALLNAAAILPTGREAERNVLRAAEDLAAVLVRLRAILESTTDAIAVTDAEGRIIDHNDNLLRLWGIPAERIVRAEPRELAVSMAGQLANPVLFLSRIEEIRASSPPETFDVLELADGRAFERHSRILVVAGEIRGRVWSFRDITTSRRSAAELRDEREWFRVILASIGDAVITTDLAGRITHLNPAAEKMTGWTNAQAAQRPFTEIFRIVDERSREPADDPVARVLQEDRVVELPDHAALIGRDGTKVAIVDTAAPIRDGTGKIAGAVMVFHDETARRRTEDTLRDREQRLRAILGQAAIGIAVASLDGRLEEVNRRFAQILDYMPAELEGKSMDELTCPEDLPETLRHMRALLDGQVDEYAIEKRYLRKGGGLVWSQTSVALVKDDQGKPQHLVVIIADITRRKTAEAALQRNEEQLRAMADSIPQLAWMAEADGNIFWYNRKWFEYTGTTPEQMRGWGWQSVHDPDMLPRVLERWRESIRTGTPFEMEFPLRGADGNFRWFLTRVNPVRDSDGGVVRWFGTNTDVDQVKRVEDALRDETRVLELLNRTGTAIAAKLDLQDLLQTVTDAATQLSGAKFGAFFYAKKDAADGVFTLFTLSGAPRHAFEKLGHPRATAIFGPTFEGKPPIRCDDVLRDPRYGKMAPHHGMPEGHLPVRSYLGVPVVSRSGEVLGGLFFGHPQPGVFTERSERIIVGVAAQAAVAIDNARLYVAAQEEIARRIHTEQQLRESEARLRVSLETAALGTWELDLKTERVTLDQRCAELFHVSGVVSMKLEDFLAIADPQDRQRRTGTLLALARGDQERYDIEYRVAATGRWVRASAKPLRDQAGVIVALTGAVQDVSDMVKARQTEEERRRELERLVDERTASLQAAIAQMDEFSYSVSHDLRGPLRSIQGYADTVIEEFGEKIGPEGVEYLRRILNAGNRMDRLTRDVLTYSKIARQSTPLAAVDLDRLLLEVVEQYIPAECRDGRVTIVPPILPVLGQEALLVQVVSNLVANAVKFARDGLAPQVRIWTERRDPFVRLCIQDNGIGIPPEYQMKIWGMFERVHAKTQYEGTGIGLAIVRKSVERMGGTVGVESDGETGSRFWVDLRAP